MATAPMITTAVFSRLPPTMSIERVEAWAPQGRSVVSSTTTSTVRHSAQKT